ncbi:MAG TPA: TIGR04063 family PEP-CTERM/XrtA system glycosyltransferase [Salinisphaeraceae bacterium]|nr:TIGR04063 family PEP-CTERM/XrtA system glycosyltransferase [Salinisphaeraceae bacterium]
MRILHVLDHSVPLHSGYAFRTLAIVREQQRRGWQPYLLTGPKQNSGAVLEEEAEGWQFYRTPYAPRGMGRWPLVGELGLMRALQRRLQEVVQAVRPDIIHAHSPVLNGLPALRVARKNALPFVYEVRAFWEDAAVEHGTSRAGGVRYRASRALETHVLRRADAVTTICNGLRDAIASRKVPMKRITVIPNAVDPAHFTHGTAADAELRQSLALDDCTVLGFAGSFYSYEGLEILVRALPLMQDWTQQVKLLLIGGGPEEQRLRSLVAELGLNDAAIFTGRVPHAEMPRYYGLIDVLVYPRLRHRLTELVTPLKPLEAMAQHKLVAASDVGGHRELISDGKTGFLFAAESPTALAARVGDILATDGDTLQSVRTTARQYVEAERCWSTSVARYESVYGSCSGDKQEAAARRSGASQ